MDDTPDSSRGFVPRILPWGVGAVAFLVYLLTLCHTVNHLSFDPVFRGAGWLWDLPYQTPLLYLVGLPFRFLSGANYILALNGLTALFAASVLTQLARSVALLPHDRTRDQRSRGHGDETILHIRLAWVPPVFAAALAGLQLTFWEHATAFTGEMIDLLLFSFCVRAILEYRVDLDERWLTPMAFVFGLGVANNWAMIGFALPFLIAVIWVRGLSFFESAFLMRAAGCLLAGLTLYLLMPIVAVMEKRVGASFSQALMTILDNQKTSLTSLPRGRFLLYALITIAPLIMIGIRWAGTKGSSVEKFMTAAALHLLQFACLLGIIILAFDLPEFTPRDRTFGVPLLTFHYLGALAAGYFLGFGLLVYGQRPGRDHSHGRGVLVALGPVAGGLLLVGAAAVPVAIAWRNIPQVRDTGALAELSAIIRKSLPSDSSILVADNTLQLQIVELARRLDPSLPEQLLIHSGNAQRPDYRQWLTARYGAAWPGLKDWTEARENLAGRFLNQLLAAAPQGKAWYLHPSFGVFFEQLQQRPHGLVVQLSGFSSDQAVPAPLSAEEIRFNVAQWNEFGRVFGQLGLTNDLQRLIAARVMSRSANYVGVELQRAGQLEDADRLFQMARLSRSDNISAIVNGRVNQFLRKKEPLPADAGHELSELSAPALQQQILAIFGPVDEPAFLRAWGTSCLSTGEDLVRQALISFDRARALAPDVPSSILSLAGGWLAADYPDRVLEIARELRQRNSRKALSPPEYAELVRLEAAAMMKKGDAAGAEKLLKEARSSQPENIGVLDALSYLYIRQNRLPEATDAVSEWIQIKPDDLAALLRRSLIQMRQSQYLQALDTLNLLIKAHPNNATAIMNRGISLLQLQRHNEALQDYLYMEKNFPKMHEIHYGLGEIYTVKKNQALALESFARYLELAPKDTAEYTNVVERLAKLMGGSK
ncbi:MAG: tetratricopeptide repeat protein [Pedosphaera sp.]|nr:tetratricopeptide repeat protein [Pedosphaera sp.]